MARRSSARDAKEATGRVAGVACTASLVSDRPKHGAHRIHVVTANGRLHGSRLAGTRQRCGDRSGEELLATRLLLNMLARACGLPDRMALDLQSPEQVVEDGTVAPTAWRQLFAGEPPLDVS